MFFSCLYLVTALLWETILDYLIKWCILLCIVRCIQPVSYITRHGCLPIYREEVVGTEVSKVTSLMGQWLSPHQRELEWCITHGNEVLKVWYLAGLDVPQRIDHLVFWLPMRFAWSQGVQPPTAWKPTRDTWPYIYWIHMPAVATQWEPAPQQTASTPWWRWPQGSVTPKVPKPIGDPWP